MLRFWNIKCHNSAGPAQSNPVKWTDRWMKSDLAIYHFSYSSQNISQILLDKNHFLLFPQASPCPLIGQRPYINTTIVVLTQSCRIQTKSHWILVELIWMKCIVALFFYFKNKYDGLLGVSVCGHWPTACAFTKLQSLKKTEVVLQ